MLDPEFETKAIADDRIVSVAELQMSELTAATAPLERVSDADIIGVIASLPEEWGINILEREALRVFLTRRRLALLEKYS